MGLPIVDTQMWRSFSWTWEPIRLRGEGGSCTGPGSSSLCLGRPGSPGSAPTSQKTQQRDASREGVAHVPNPPETEPCAFRRPRTTAGSSGFVERQSVRGVAFVPSLRASDIFSREAMSTVRVFGAHGGDPCLFLSALFGGLEEQLA